MSNYPLPPTPPGPFGSNFGAYPPDPTHDALAPARRAGVMLWILGGVGMLCGVCIATSVWIAPADKLLEHIQTSISPEQRSQLQGIDIVKVARILVTIACILEMVLAAVMLATAYFVRNGSRGAIITSMIPCALLLLWCLLLLLINVGALAMGTIPKTGLVDVFLWAMIALGSGITFLWLMQAMGAARQIAQQKLFAAQHWHYQQQQQQNTGYGYGAQAAPQSQANPQTWITAPPPPPPSTATPPPPSTFTPPPPPPESSPTGGAGGGTDEPKT